jgi:hypothetical protein
MLKRHSYHHTLGALWINCLAALLAGCGGSTEDARPGATGGSTAILGTGGDQAVGGNSGTGGPPGGGQGGATNPGAGGAAGVGGSSIGLVDCSTIACPASNCAPGYTEATFDGDCCPSCVANDPSCANVICATNLNCPSTTVVRRQPGACCDTCVLLPSAPYASCETVDCAPPASCPLGFVSKWASWSCCNPCQPDPNFCETDSDCIWAWDTSQCCGCAESISRRRFNQDYCYSNETSQRPVPASCAPKYQAGPGGPSYDCSMVSCSACPAAQGVVCSSHTCTALALP